MESDQRFSVVEPPAHLVEFRHFEEAEEKSKCFSDDNEGLREGGTIPET